MQGYVIFFVVIILFCIIIPNRNRFILNRIIKKKRGVKRKMPNEMLKEFIGKNCTVSLFNEVGAINGTIIAVEENWIKVEEKKRIRIINGDMIRDISVLKV